MEITLNEMKERIIAQWDEETLLSILNLDITDLVNILEDHIIERYEQVLNELEA